MNNNNYIKIYAEMFNKKSNNIVSKNSIKNTKSLKTVLLENKRKCAKQNCKKLIFEEDNKNPKDFYARIDVLTEIISVDDAENWKSSPKILALPKHIFNDNFSTKDISAEEVSKFGLKEAAYKAKADFDEKKLDDKHCLLYFFIINELENDGGESTGVIIYVLGNSHNMECYEIVPKDSSWMLKASQNVKTYAEANKEDRLFYFAANNITFPLDALNACTNLVQGIGGALAKVGKEIAQHSPFIKFFSKKFGKDEEKKEKDYTKLVQQYLNRIQEIRDQKMDEFMKIDKALRTKIKALLKGDEVEGLPNYKKMIEEKKPLSKAQFLMLKDFAEKEFAPAMAASTAFEDISKDPSQLPDTPSKDDINAYKNLKNDPNFKNTANALGFRDKKKLEGLAGLFQKLLDGIFSLFGSDDPTEVESDKIKELMPAVAKYAKGLEPGDYPIFFGGANAKLSPDDINKKFKEMNKK